MAQIIKHRRGSLESVASATKRAGELLVVTGSAGITAANGDSLLFLGVDGSTVTPANKFFQGTSVPDLTGANYDTSVDGIPFYDTSAEKLYILNKGGNVEVKATANTGGTGIVSSSAQIDSLGFLQVNGDSVVSSSAQISAYNTFLEINGDSVVSGSSQITISSTTGYTSFSSSLASTDAGLDSRIVSLENFSSSLGNGFATDAELAAVSSAFDSTIGALTTDDISEGSALYFTDARVKTKLNAEGVISSSVQVNADSITNFDSNVKDKLNADGVISGSSQVNADSITNFDSNVLAYNNSLGVISGSSQVQINSVTGFTTFSSSVDSRVDALEAAVGAGSNIDGRLSSLEAFSGSTETSLAAIHTHTASVDQDITAIHAYTSSLKTAISVSGANLTVLGNLEVQGTTTTVDSTTITLGDNIIELNGSGAANGGLLVKDVTNPNTISGSLLWDSTNDYWKGGALGSEVKFLRATGDAVVSGSAQIDLSGVTGDTDDVTEGSTNLYYLDSRVKTKLNAETVISGSSQVNADSITNFDSNVKDKLNLDGVISGSSQVNADSITNFDSNVKDKLNADTVISGSSQVQIASVTGFTAFSSSVDSRIDSLEGSSLSSATAASTYLAINGDGVHSGSAQVVSALLNQNINFGTGGISGSSLDITGNAKIDGNLVLGGNITIGDASSDTISFGGDVASDILPSATNTYDLGSATDKFAEIHGTTIFGSISATNGVVSGSAQTIGHLNGSGVISGSAQLLNVATDFGSGRVSGDNFGDVAGTSTFTGSFVGDGSGLTGLATDLSISGSTGNDVVDLLNDALTFAGGTGVTAAVTNNTVTYSVQDASTSQKGIASFGSTNFAVSSGNVTIKAGGVPATALNADVAGTGISLNGVDNSVEVDYGATAGTAVEGNTSLTVQGTSNEISVSGGSVTLGNGGTVTIGLPDSVTIATASISDDLDVGGNLTVTGNLSVLGTTTTIDSTTVQIGDNILELNIGGAQSTAGLQVTDSTGGNTVSGSLLWDGTNDYWKAGALGSEKEIARLNASPTSNTVLKADANGLLVDSLITDDGTNVTISGTAELRINGATANSFVYFDSNKSLEAVTPANAGDVIQWNGSSFVASNEIDGGTF